MYLGILLLIGGLFLLIKGSDIFVEASVKISKIFAISEMLIGMTLVCFGTSLPELFVSVNASIKGTADLVVGNMVGTNIFNICVILGFLSIVHPIRFVKATVRKDMYMSLATAAVFFLVIFDKFGTNLSDNVVSRTDGALLLIMFIIYMYYNLYHFKDLTYDARQNVKLRQKAKLEGIEFKKHKKKLEKAEKKEVIKNILIVVIGAILVYVGSECVVYGATEVATNLGVSQSLIAILVISVGTSLPEIATSYAALKKGRVSIAIGNLIGSNMFNMLFVTGASALVNPLTISVSTLWIDALVFIFISLVLILFTKVRYVKKGKYELSRTDGIILIALYVAYITFVIIRK